MLILILVAMIVATSSSSPARAAAALPHDVPPPYAVIDWPDPLNPRFVALGNDRFLLATRTGMQVWDAQSNSFSQTRHFLPNLELRGMWGELSKGRLIVGSSRSSDGTPFDSLIWWNAHTRDFSAPLTLPTGTVVQDIVSVDEQHVLVCMRRGLGPPGRGVLDLDAFAARAAVVGLDNGQPRLLDDKSAALRAALIAAGVRGLAEGSAAIGDDADVDRKAPLVFRTQSCKWEIRRPPEELASATDLTIQHHRLPDGRLLIAHADWYEAKRQTRATLSAPYVWDGDKGQWVAIATTAQEGSEGSTFRSYGIADPVVSVSAVDARFVEFLDPETLRWTRSAQLLPAGAYGPLLAPFGSRSTLVFLREKGQVLLFTPMVEAEAGVFAFPHPYLGEIPLSDGLLLAGGGTQWHPANRPELLRTSPKVESRLIAPMPSPLGYVAGVELKDRTILVFGGLRARCAPSSMYFDCKHGAASPTYRYFPQQDRWEEVPGLRVRFANGEPWDFGNSEVASQWARHDATARRNGDFVVLDGPANYDVSDHDMTPLATHLMRWHAGSAPVRLGKLKAVRVFASLIELNDGRLIVAGGETAKTLGISHEQCDGCDDESTSSGAVEPSASTEVFEDATGRWVTGPKGNYEGGQALKLANGRIFKVSLTRRWAPGEGYRAEIADAAFTHWTKLPAPPSAPTHIRHLAVAGNRVLILLDGPSMKTVVWDDERRAWEVWDQWTKEVPLSITPIDNKRAIARTQSNYEVVSFPK